jgi:two-component system, LytTR family, response regulator LytT
LPDLALVGKCKSPIQALDVLQNDTIDILFLDIQMPVLSGTNLLKTLQRPPATIFTTAYSEHAVEAFDLNAVDYLLKPFSFERFLQAVNKAKDFLNKKEAPQYSAHFEGQKSENEAENAKEYMVAKVDGRIEKIFFNEIHYVEGLKEYVKIVCTARHYVVLESMKNLEEFILPTNDFLRVHKSYIVAKNRVKTLEGNQLDIGGKIKIPISRERKEEIVKAIFGI